MLLLRAFPETGFPFFRLRPRQASTFPISAVRHPADKHPTVLAPTRQTEYRRVSFAAYFRIDKADGKRTMWLAGGHRRVGDS